MQNIYKYERVENSMSKKKKHLNPVNNNTNNINNEITQESLIINKEKIKKFFNHPITATVIGALILSFIGYINGFLALPEKVSNIEEQSTETQNQMNKIQDSVDSVDSDISDLRERIAKLEGINEGLIVQLLTSSAEVQNTFSEDNLHTAGPSWDSNDIIALDVNTGEKYYASELIGENILTMYEEDGYEIVFYGQYNENYHWNNTCLTNTYLNGQLVFAMEGFYDDGELREYRQISSESVGESNTKVWTLSKRTVNDNINSGISINYYRENEIQKDFEKENLQIENIKWIGDLEKQISGEMEGFYYGNTSNGKYNDDTGNAYLVKYAKDGTVRTLYVGNFVDGGFSDNTGEAWYIVKNDKTNYMYYKGTFANNSPANDKNSEFKNNLTIEEIEKLISDYSFKCDLTWYKEYL